MRTAMKCKTNVVFVTWGTKAYSEHTQIETRRAAEVEETLNKMMNLEKQIAELMANLQQSEAERATQKAKHEQQVSTGSKTQPASFFVHCIDLLETPSWSSITKHMRRYSDNWMRGLSASRISRRRIVL